MRTIASRPARSETPDVEFRAEEGDLPLRTLVIELTEGSRLRGGTTVETVDLATPYARMQVDVQHIQSITPSDDGQALLAMRSGDRMMGEVNLTEVSLVTGCGPVSIEWPHIRKIDVVAVASQDGVVAK